MPSISLKSIEANNARIVDLIGKAATREPATGAYQWTSGTGSAVRDVVTFKTDGKNKGSLERFAEANKISSKVYTMMREAVAYGAHSTQGSSGGILAFDATPKNLALLEKKLNAIYKSRDTNHDKQLDDKEQGQVKKLSNGKALLAGRAELSKTKTTGLRTEHTFSRKVNYLVDLLYKNGNIYGQSHVDNLVKGMSSTQAKAVRNAYAVVSRYMSKGATDAMSFICMDQRREVTRGLMRVFGASLDDTEKSINALTLPSKY